ncbi:MAG TPA: cyclase family protein [Bryobacteraceae bacterium]|nr:cyclase family protein [Bryobacteraceae bacterium]
MGILLLTMGLLCAALSAQPPRFPPSKLVDLTWAFDENTIYWPTAQPFRYEKENWGKGPGGYFYASGRYSASEHGGTHMDAPVHFAEGKTTVDAIPVADLFLPAAVIDISAKCATSPDYQLQLSDVAAWERAHGRIPPDSAVLVRTGWGRFWPDKRKYLGTAAPGDVAGLHFPGIGEEAAKALAARGIRAVGIDTPSIDYGRSRDFLAHRVLYALNIYGLENIANLEKVPAQGAILIALPMKIGGGTGAPVRIVALLP